MATVAKSRGGAPVQTDQDAQPAPLPTDLVSAPAATPGASAAPAKAERRGKKAADHAGTVRKVREAGWIERRKDKKRVWRSELWRGRVMLDGSPRDVYGKTEAEAQTRLDDLKVDLRRGTYQKPDRRTVGQLLDEYIADGQARRLKPKTLFFYRQTRDLYVSEALKRVKLHELRAEHVRRWMTEQAGKNLSSTTIRNTRAVLNAAVEFALRQEWVTRNVVELVKSPKRVKPALRPPTPAEMGRLIEAAERAKDRLTALWTLAAHAGCRPGELLALCWSNVDLKTGIITVERTLSKVPGEALRFDSTKTDRIRRVRIGPDATAALKAHHKAQLDEIKALGVDFENHGLVFCLETGAPLLERHAVTKFKQALARADLPADIRFYDMRHGNATAMLLSGVAPKAAAERLGHTSTQLFHDTYAHMLDEIDADAAAKLQNVIGGRRAAAG